MGCGQSSTANRGARDAKLPSRPSFIRESSACDGSRRRHGPRLTTNITTTTALSPTSLSRRPFTHLASLPTTTLNRNPLSGSEMNSFVTRDDDSAYDDRHPTTDEGEQQQQQIELPPVSPVFSIDSGRFDVDRHHHHRNHNSNNSSSPTTRKSSSSDFSSGNPSRVPSFNVPPSVGGGTTMLLPSTALYQPPSLYSGGGSNGSPNSDACMWLNVDSSPFGGPINNNNLRRVPSNGCSPTAMDLSPSNTIHNYYGRDVFGSLNSATSSELFLSGQPQYDSLDDLAPGTKKGCYAAAGTGENISSSFNAKGYPHHRFVQPLHININNNDNSSTIANASTNTNEKQPVYNSAGVSFKTMTGTPPSLSRVASTTGAADMLGEPK